MLPPSAITRILSSSQNSLLRAYQVIADQGDAANRSLAPQQNCSLRDQDGFGENFQYALKAAADSDQKYYIALEMQAARRIARFLDRRGRQVGVQPSSSAGAEAADVATLECACCYGDEVAERMVSCDGEAGHVRPFPFPFSPHTRALALLQSCELKPTLTLAPAIAVLL